MVLRLPAALFLATALGFLACTGSDPGVVSGNVPGADAGPGAAGAGFALRPPGTAVIAPNETVRVPVEIERRGGFAGAVSFVVQPLSEGIGVAPLTLSGGETRGELVITANADAKPVVTRLQVVATAEPALSDTKDLPFVVRGVPGTREGTFGEREGATIVPDLVPFACARTPDDGVVIASQDALVHVLADGKVDAAFGTGGRAALKQPSGRTEAVHVASDGKISVFVWTEERTSVAVHRFLPGGAYDVGYGTEGVAIHALAEPDDQPYSFGGDVDAQGRAVVGIVPGTDGTSTFVRFLADGKPDAAFDAEKRETTTGAWQQLRVLGETPVVLGAGFYDGASETSKYAVSLVTSASSTTLPLDYSSINPAVEGVTVDGKGRMLLAGHGVYRSGADTFAQATIVRVNPAGTLDETFGDGAGYVEGNLGDAVQTYAQLRVALEESSGKILGVGRRESTAGRAFILARYDAEGRADPTFGKDGIVAETLPGAESTTGAYLQSVPTVVVVRSYDGGAALVTRYWR